MLRLWLLLAFLALAAPTADAVVTATPVFVQTPKIGTVTFVQGTDAAGTYKTLYLGGANGSKITGIFVTSNDTTTSHLVTVQVSTSTTLHCSPQSNCLGGAAVTIPISAGFVAGTPAVNMLAPANWPGLPIDSDGNPFLILTGNTQTIEATFATALGASTQVSIVLIAADF